MDLKAYCFVGSREDRLFGVDWIGWGGGEGSSVFMTSFSDLLFFFSLLGTQRQKREVLVPIF